MTDPKRGELVVKIPNPDWSDEDEEAFQQDHEEFNYAERDRIDGVKPKD